MLLLVRDAHFFQGFNAVNIVLSRPYQIVVVATLFFFRVKKNFEVFT